ncbi:MAG: IS110 family transposase [Pseudonocardiaceae bacterium]
MLQRTSVGLDVHARSVVGCGLDGQTGELFERRLIPDHGQILRWLRSLPGPVAVAYEAGPTGFGLARFLGTENITCLAAPSKLQRPSGDRVKTDTRDARHLARLLHLGQIVAVAVPRVEQEAARDLVRAREDVRGDLMSAGRVMPTPPPDQVFDAVIHLSGLTLPQVTSRIAAAAGLGPLPSRTARACHDSCVSHG